MTKKRFLGYDACGTDGADQKKMSAIFEIVDDAGFTTIVRISATSKDPDADLMAELAKQEPSSAVLTP